VLTSQDPTQQQLSGIFGLSTYSPRA
jgi:hypothetical protein